MDLLATEKDQDQGRGNTSCMQIDNAILRLATMPGTMRT